MKCKNCNHRIVFIDKEGWKHGTRKSYVTTPYNGCGFNSGECKCRIPEPQTTEQSS